MTLLSLKKKLMSLCDEILDKDLKNFINLTLKIKSLMT